MMQKEIITLFLWFLLSVYVAIESWRMGLGSFREPGPGFLTFWVSLIIALLTLVLGFKEKGRKIARHAVPFFKGINLRNIIWGFSFLFAYPLLLNRLGFFLCNLLFVGFCLKVIVRKNWRVTVGVSSGVAIFTYLLFNVWLSLPLPQGRWVSHLLSFWGF